MFLIVAKTRCLETLKNLELWYLRSGNGLNPLSWTWDASRFCCRDKYKCGGLTDADSVCASSIHKLANIGIDDDFTDKDGINKGECLKAFNAFRKVCMKNVSYNEIRGKTQGDRWPEIDTVDLNSFMGRLRCRTGFDAFDLPTEAEWEYAARAGSKASLTNGQDIMSEGKDDNLAEVARYAGNRGLDTHAEVGSYKPNRWGIYDVQGNVFEWCLDRYGRENGGAQIDPKGPKKGDLRVLRSGAWLFAANTCRLASRIGKNKSKSDGTMGFRVACR